MLGRAIAIYGLLGAMSGGCATAPCNAVVKQDASPAEREQLAQEQARCEQRLKRMHRTLDEQHKEREVEAQRDAFRGRSDAKAHGR